MKRATKWMPATGPLVIGLVACAVLATVVMVVVGHTSKTRVSAEFTNSVGLYEGDPVTIAGVPVGTVDAITPRGATVRVEMSFDSKYDVPVDASAAIVAPTLVTGRYVQLAPTYSGGPTLSDGAAIPVQRTAVPVEFDQLKDQLSELTADLGPEGLNADGSVNQLLASSADALSGNGATLGETVRSLSEATTTLNDSGEDIFATVRNLQVFVSTLSENDEQVDRFVRQLAALSNLLNNNRTEFDAALQELVPAMEQVRTFVADNKDQLSTDVTQLVDITQLLVNREDDVAQLLHVAPTALSNLYNIWDPSANSLTGALAVPDRVDPLNFICGLLTTVGAPQNQCADIAAQLGGVAAYAVPPTPATDGTEGGGR